MTEDKVVGQHHQLNGHEYEQTPGDSEGQGSLACCSPLGHNESDTTQQLRDNIVQWRKIPGDWKQGKVLFAKPQSIALASPF